MLGDESTARINSKLFKPSLATESHRTAGALGYMPALDGLRAIAVLSVLVSHFGLGPTLSAIERALPWGHMGVQLFFVLSGLLITNILLKCRENISNTLQLKQTLKVFYIRRALRIFPAYYATILLFFLFGSEEFRTVVVYHLFYLSNTVSATFDSDGLIHPASAHFWSLSVEEQFYIFWPLVVFLVPTRRLALVGICLVLVAPISRAGLFALGYSHIVGYLFTATDALGMGALLALLKGGYLHGSVNQHLRFGIAVSAVGFFACLATYNLNIWFRPREILFPLFGSVMYAFLIHSLLSGRLPRTSSFLAWRPLVLIGQVSYTIYLTHTLLMDGIEFIYPEVATLGFIRFSLGTFVTVLVALLSWRIFEGPINQKKSIFKYPESTALSKFDSPAG